MSTIDQLAPATSASDSDEFVVSQGGITRKVTRAQILNGVQAQVTIPPNTLLGRAGTNVGIPQAISVGQNLSFNGSTLSAVASPFPAGALPSGTVPSSSDLIAASQAGKTVAITYGQLMNGIAGIGNINVSQALVTPAGAASSQTLARLTAAMLPLSGGTLTGTLTLAASPKSPLHASSKAYVDQQISTALALAGGSMSGMLSLAVPPQNQMDAVTKSYADGISARMLQAAGGSLTGPLLLSADPTNSLQASTKRYVDLKLARTGDTLSGTLSLAADPIFPLQAATKSYVDAQVSGSLAKSGGTLSGKLLLAADPTNNAEAATKQYVDRRVNRTGDTLTGPLVLAANPVSALQAANKNYVDTQLVGSVARSGSSMTGALLLVADPATPLQASTKQYVDLHVMRNGDTLLGPLVLAGDPTVPSHAATKQYVDRTLAAAITPAGGTFSGPVTLANDPVQVMQATTKRYADTKIGRGGDSMTGTLLLASDPIVQTQAATKNYVDVQAARALPLIGGSLVGPLILSADPVSLSQAATKRYVDNKLATALPLNGISLTGALILAGAPLVPFQAATKSYVDANPNAQGVINVKLPPYGAKIDGVTDDTAAFKAAYQAAVPGSAIYVPNGITVLQLPSTWGIALTKYVKWIVDGTTLSDGTWLSAGIPTGGAPATFVLPGFVVGNTPAGLTTSQGSSQSADFAVNQSSYIVNHSGGPNGTVIANVRADTIIYSSPGNYVWGGLDRLVWAGTQTPSAAAPAQHVGRYIQTLRQSPTTASNGSFLPQPQLWGACIEYSDTTGQPSSATNNSITIEMDWFGNGLDNANSRAIQSLVIGQHNLKGPAVEVANIIGVYLSLGSAGSAKTVFGIGVPFSNAVLDTTNATQINNAPVIKMSAGQAIAFEGTNSNRLAFDSSTNTLRWNQGTLSYPVGKGISVGQGNVYPTSTVLPNYTSGNFILLNGSSPYSMTLPSASTVAAGTGFTFSVTGSAAVTILTSGSDTTDSGPIVLRPHDRYHIVSDGVSLWHEVFWTNAVSPRFSGPMVLPSYTVVNLPVGVSAGAKAFASNGRKPNEATGSGTGVEVFFDGQHWISSCGGTVAAA